MRPQSPPVTPKDWDPHYAKLFTAVSKRGLKMKSAAEEGRRAVTYLKGQNLCRVIFKNLDALKKEAPEVFDENEVKDIQDVTRIGQRLVEKGFIYQVHPVVMNIATSPGDEASEALRADQQLKKWPNRVERKPGPQAFVDDGFYVVLFEQKSPLKIVLLVSVIVGVLILCMFPAWPLRMKFIAWYITFCLSSSLIFICILRLILFVILWFAGCDFWLFPNIFAEDLGVIASFKPTYSFQKRDDDKIMKIARVACFILCCAAGFQISRTHSLDDINQFAKRQLLDVLEWGENKISSPDDGSFGQPALSEEAANPDSAWVIPSTEEDQPEEDYSCLKLCGFDSYEILSEECLVDCKCMEELVKTRCYAKCPEGTKEILEEAKLDACYTEKMQQQEAEKVEL